MGTTLGQIITAARNKHAAFHKKHVPDVLLASHLSDVQRQLITAGSELDSSKVAVNCNIVFATSGANAPGVVGAATAGGLPGELNGAVIQMPDGDSGPTIELDLDDAVILAADRAALSATLTTVTVIGAPGWAVNAFANKVALVSEGFGKGQVRKILSNTANQLTISSGADGEQWVQTPDTTSVIRVVDFLLVADEKVSATTRLPPNRPVQGYLIQLDANGQPFINLAAPLSASIDNGIPLPPHERVIGGSVRLTMTSGLDPLTSVLTIKTYAERYHWGPSYTCWLEGGRLFLSGTMADWTNALSIDLRIIPIPDDLVRLTDFFLLPDLAGPVLIAEAADFMAMRCSSMEDVPPIDVKYFSGKLSEARDNFLLAYGASNRAHAVHVHEVW